MMHEAGPWRLVDERGSDNFHTSIYGADQWDGLLVARGNQNGQHAQDMRLMRAAPDLLHLLREARFHLSGDLATRIDALVASVSPES